MRREFTLQLYDRIELPTHAHDCPVCYIRVLCSLPNCHIVWTASTPAYLDCGDRGRDRYCRGCNREPQDHCTGCGGDIAISDAWKRSWVGALAELPHDQWCLSTLGANGLDARTIRYARGK